MQKRWNLKGLLKYGISIHCEFKWIHCFTYFTSCFFGHSVSFFSSYFHLGYKAQLLVYNPFFLPSFYPLNFCYSHKFHGKPQGISIIYIYTYILNMYNNRHIHVYYSNLQKRHHGKFQCSVQLLHSRKVIIAFVE